MIDAMQSMLPPDQFIGFLRGSIFKYLWRYDLKHGVKDLEKAKVYLDWLIEEEDE